MAGFTLADRVVKERMRNRIPSGRWLLSAIVVAATLGPLVPSAWAQGGAPDRPRGSNGPRNPEGLPGIAPAEIQRMLDGYELMQAQEMLQIGDEQLPSFLPRLRTLQDVRRRAQAQRIRVIQELRGMTRSRSTLDEARIKDSLRVLDDLEVRSAMEIRQAREALDQGLDVYQQARFRLFESMMERRKVELVMRARQADRQNRAPDPAVP
jgi:hypothetical protein